MADSNVTKRMLALTLKELMKTESFEKVSVSDICEACDVSRKTFYYHFQDKYALAEWIFDTEVIKMMKKAGVTDRYAFIDTICQYLYRERKFYINLLHVTGQNSFREYLLQFFFEALESLLLEEDVAADAVAAAANQENLVPDEVQDFCLHFVSGAIMLAIFRWLMDGAKIPPDQFVARLKGSAEMLGLYLQREYPVEGDEAKTP